MLDASGSVSSTDFKRVTNFAEDIIDFVVQNASQTQLACAFFSTTVTPIFQLKTFVALVLQLLSNKYAYGLAVSRLPRK
jgi:hypothetical protein